MLKQVRASQSWNDKNLAQKGFTLVELLVVISILGILAAVVVFSVSGVTDKGQTSACKTDAKAIRTAVETYRAQNNATDDPTMVQLVPNYLQQASTLWTISYASHVVSLANTGGATGACNGVTG